MDISHYKLHAKFSFHHISSDPGCDMVVLKDEPDMDSSNKISFLQKKSFFGFLSSILWPNNGEYTSCKQKWKKKKTIKEKQRFSKIQHEIHLKPY
ncbi:unnamed protein product [Spirodela intermedia]|uniref:Ycf2 N-terminal domain-containing protein n=1 Tax=Spirodela intermedia TaxID=51605 RepID=A0A7I8L6N8_SPIIN|nr:unnamed protein product [Spirodela intermedia]